MEKPPFWPRPNPFRDALRKGGPPPVVTWITLQSPNIVEMVGVHGVEAVILDMEHTASGVSEIQPLLVAAQCTGMTALVRPPMIEPHLVGQLLDAGADGIVFPMVSSRREAETAARSLRYPPSGTRGWAGSHARHVRWTGAGAAGPEFRLLSPEFVAAVNDRIAGIFMIESRAGLDNLEAILDTGRPDGVIFGWADFAVDAAFDEQLIASARQHIYDECRKRQIGILISVVPRDKLEYYPGCFFSAGVDATIASDAVGARISEVRGAIAAIRSSDHEVST